MKKRKIGLIAILLSLCLVCATVCCACDTPQKTQPNLSEQTAVEVPSLNSLYDLSYALDSELIKEQPDTAQIYDKYLKLAAFSASVKAYSDNVKAGTVALHSAPKKAIDNCVEFLLTVADETLLAHERELFADDTFAAAFTAELGEEYVTKRLAIPDTRYFANRSHEVRSADKANELLTQIKTLCSDKLNEQVVCCLYSAFLHEEYLINENLARLNIDYSLDVIDEENIDKFNQITATANAIFNEGEKAKEAFFASPCVQYAIDEGVISAAEVEAFGDNSNILSDEAIALSSELNEMGNRYTAIFNEVTDENWEQKSTELNELLANITKKRREFNALVGGYENYGDYCYDKTYFRDYSPENSLTLCNSVKENLLPLISELYANSNKYITLNTNGILSSMTIDEDFYLELLQSTENVWEEFANSYDEMIEYGLYEFSFGENKMDAGYCLTYGTTDVILYIYPYGDYNDVSQFVHEFGHFNEHRIYDECESTGLPYNYDVAEIHSQGLELLMCDYYDDMYNEKDLPRGDVLARYSVLKIIDTVLQAAAVTEFEYFLYHCDDTELTAEKIGEKFDEIFAQYGQERYLPMDISHLYNRPNYYASYLTSAIASLEIFSQPTQEQAEETYVKLTKYGAFVPFLATVEKVGLSSPFEESTIRNIAAFLNDYFGMTK